MRKAQKNFKLLKFFIPLMLIFYFLIFFNLHYFLFQFLFSNPIMSFLIPIWSLTFIFFSSNRIFSLKVKKETKYRILFYSIFITFLLFYFQFLPNFAQLILATTTPSGCTPCSQVAPEVYILSPSVGSEGNMSVSVAFQCCEWPLAKNLTLSMKIDNSDWNLCFLNTTTGLMKDFGWSSNCDQTTSGCCGVNNVWCCDSTATCKHKNYDLWVKSNFTIGYANVTFICKLPPLTSGLHTLNVTVKVYTSETTLKPSVTFFVIQSERKNIIEIILLPLKILKRLLLF